MHDWANPRERELWREFRDRMHGGELEGWLYGGAANGSDRPADLGCWIGYGICAAYYARTTDKARAIRDVLAIGDFDASLGASGYDPSR